MSQEPLNLLCIEPRFPGRLGGVADWLVRRRGYRCQFYFHSADSRENWPKSVGDGMSLVQFNVGGVARDPSVHWTRQLERGLCYAYGCWEVMEARRPRPVDVVLGRSNGLGSTLFTPVYAPRIPIVNLFDYFYRAHEHDLAGDSSAEAPAEYFQWRRSAVATDLLDLENDVIPWTLTEWQRELFPPEYHSDFHVLFDGVDMRQQNREPIGSRVLQGRTIPAGARVVSFVARNMDRTRGFERFLGLANRLLRSRSDVICIAIGDSIVQRALDIEFYNKDYATHVLCESPAHDPDRLWLLGATEPRSVADLLDLTDLHVYPSRPYIVSHSMIEAMGAGRVVLASDCEPVREFITHDQTGLLAPERDLDAWEQTARAVLNDSEHFRSIGERAAAHVRENYDREVTMPRMASWLSDLK